VSRHVWRRAGRADLPELAAFLAAREEGCAGFTGRLLRDGELQLPLTVRGGLWIAEAGGAIAGAALCHHTRLAIPLLPVDRDSDALLGALLSARMWTAASAIGAPSDLDRFEALCGLEIRFAVPYRLMRLAGAPPSATGAAAPPGLEVRVASYDDLDALFPLQTAYEYEEVLTPLHRFDAAACRASLGRALKEQLVFVAEEGGKIVAKAGTNARGLGCDQIGGVFTLPERRGRGIGRALVGRLTAAIAELGRKAVLFVKPDNSPALSLYRHLGFEDIGPYRADYFDS